jgi:hypothetical protein
VAETATTCRWCVCLPPLAKHNSCVTLLPATYLTAHFPSPGGRVWPCASP